MKKIRFISIFVAIVLLVSGFSILPAYADVTDKTAAEWAAELGVSEQSIIFPSGSVRLKDYHNAQVAQAACNEITFLPGGVYYMKSFIDPGDGLKVHATGATIYIVSCTSGFFCDLDNKKPQYTNTVGVTIEGGTWIHRAKSKPKKPVSALKFVHASDITIRNMNIVTDYASHMVEFIGVKDALIEGCTFAKEKKHYFPSVDEVIQLDIASGGKNAVGIYPDNTNCKNIVIRNNNLSFFRGIVNNASGANITITGNTISTTKSNCVALYNVENITVENNLFLGSGAASVIFTKKCKGNIASPSTMSKLTVAALKPGMTKITGTKDKAGILTLTINGQQYTYNTPGVKYAINVPAMPKGTVVTFEQTCSYGNIYRFSKTVK